MRERPLKSTKGLEELSIQAEIDQVREPKRIFMHSVSDSPAVLIDGMIAREGRVPRIDEIKDWINLVEPWRP